MIIVCPITMNRSGNHEYLNSKIKDEIDDVLILSLTTKQALKIKQKENKNKKNINY